MIRRAQAEALLKLAEALEECERNGLTLESDHGEYLRLDDAVKNLECFEALTGVAVRMAVAKLYPKSQPEVKTLLSLCVAELKEWPKGVAQIAQDPDGAVYFWGKEPIHFCETRGWRTQSGFGLVDDPYCLPECHPLTEDYKTSVITKAMWLKAK